MPDQRRAHAGAVGGPRVEVEQDYHDPERRHSARIKEGKKQKVDITRTYRITDGNGSTVGLLLAN